MNNLSEEQKEYFKEIAEKMAEKYSLTTQQVGHIRQMVIGDGLSRRGAILNCVHKLTAPLNNKTADTHRNQSREHLVGVIEWLVTCTDEQFLEITKANKRDYEYDIIVGSMLQAVRDNKNEEAILDSIRKQMIGLIKHEKSKGV